VGELYRFFRAESGKRVSAANYKRRKPRAVRTVGHSRRAKDYDPAVRMLGWLLATALIIAVLVTLWLELR